MIQEIGSLIKQTKRDLHNLQIGVTRIVKTGKEEIDNSLGGALDGDVILVGGLASHGKTYYVEELKKNIMSNEINRDSSEFVSLSYNLEMKNFNLVLRGLHTATGIEKKDILKEPFPENKLPKVKEFLDNYSDNRFFVEQEAPTPEEFYTKTREFILQHQDKKLILITIDHAGLLDTSENTIGIGKMVSSINKLKMEFKNLLFIIVSQLNRSLMQRACNTDNLSFPRDSDFEYSSSLVQISTWAIIVYQPFKVNITEFGRVSPTYYDYLKDHFTEQGDDLKKVSFLTEGRIFTFVTKSRESAVGSRNIYVKNVGVEKSQVPKSHKALISEIQVPSFKDQLKPNYEFENNKGLIDNFLFENEDEENSPF